MKASYDPDLFVDRDPELRGFNKLLQPETPQAVLCISGDEYMGKTWLLDRLGDECGGQPVAGETGPPPVVKIDFRAKRGQHEIQDSLSLIRLLRNGLGCPEYFYRLNDTINWFTQGRTAALGRALEHLTEALQEHVDFQRVKQLCRVLGVNYDNLEGGEKGTLYEKTHGLIVELERRGRLPELLAELKARYEFLDWSKEEEMVLTALARVQHGAAAADGMPVEDFGAPLPVDAGSRQAKSEISQAFFEALQKLERDLKPIVLLFDSYDEAPPEIRRWIEEQLLQQLRTGLLQELVIIIAGRPDGFGLDPAMKGKLVVERELPGFGEEDIRRFLEVHRVPFDRAKLEFYIDTSGGKPGLLALMTDNEQAREQKDEGFFNE